MRITYVAARPELNGGVKVTFQHACLLHEQGHVVTVLGDGPRPGWLSFPGRYVDTSAAPARLASQDLVIGTYYTTIPAAERLGVGPVVHFCQGYEGDLVHLRERRAEIEAVYRRPGPALVVAPHLAQLLASRFGRASEIVPPAADPMFRPARRLAPRGRPWVLVPGVFEAEVKDVGTALRAVARLRARGLACRVLRFSGLPLSAAERAILAPDVYVASAAPVVIAALVARCDLLLSPALAMDGFGLPLLEAMAAKVPAVAADTPAARWIGGGAVPLVAPGDDEAFAGEAARLLGDAARWRRARRRGAEAAARFTPALVGAALARAVGWAAACAPR